MSLQSHENNRNLSQDVIQLLPMGSLAKMLPGRNSRETDPLENAEKGGDCRYSLGEFLYLAQKYGTF